MIRKFQRYIENEPWEEQVERGERYLNIFCWLAIIFAVVYFAPPVIRVIVWGPK
jgi:hypothetical protein